MFADAHTGIIGPEGLVRSAWMRQGQSDQQYAPNPPPTDVRTFTAAAEQRLSVCNSFIRERTTDQLQHKRHTRSSSLDAARCRGDTRENWFSWRRGSPITQVTESHSQECLLISTHEAPQPAEVDNSTACTHIKANLWKEPLPVNTFCHSYPSETVCTHTHTAGVCVQMFNKTCWCVILLYYCSHDSMHWCMKTTTVCCADESSTGQRLNETRSRCHCVVNPGSDVTVNTHIATRTTALVVVQFYCLEKINSRYKISYFEFIFETSWSEVEKVPAQTWRPHCGLVMFGTNTCLEQRCCSRADNQQPMFLHGRKTVGMNCLRRDESET